jgi:hypothetical protein
MRELLLEMLGWLGYLERPTVLLQLAVAIGLMVLGRFAARRNWLRQLRPRAYTPLALVVLAASCLLLALLGLPYGLSGQLGVIWLGWYGLNQLQPLPWKTPVIVSLNPSREPDPAKVLRSFEVHHPVFDQAAIDAQARLPEFQGHSSVWFCGAWTRYGFHEDGLMSGLAVADALREQIAAQRASQRAA